MSEPASLDEIMVGDRFWLAKGRELVAAGLQARDDAAAQLATAVGWFWTVYTGAALVGVSLTKRELPVWMALLIGLPAVLLILAYGAATLALMPIDVTFDARVPEEIRRAFLEAGRRKAQELNLAKALTFAAAIGVVATLVVSAGSRPESTASFQAVLRAGTGSQTILVAGDFPAAQTVVVTVTLTKGAPAGASPVSRVEHISPNGTLQDSIQLSGRADGYEVTAEWMVAGERLSITRILTAG